MDGLVLAAEGCDGASACLPLLRWGPVLGSINFRSDKGGLFSGITSMFQSLGTNMTSMFVNMGNSLWLSAVKLVQGASELDLIKDMGWRINDIFSGLTEALTSNYYLLALFALGILVSGAAMIMRPNGSAASGAKVLLKKFVAFGFAVAMLVAMGNAAAASSGKDSTPAVMSPAWVATSMQDVADKVTEGMTSGASDWGKSSFYDADAGNLSCRRYVAQLYKDADAKGGVEKDAVVRGLSSYWEDSALSFWAATQFGDQDAGATFDNQTQAFCRVLESRLNVKAQDQIDVTAKASGKFKSGDFDPNAIAWNGPEYLVANNENSATQTKKVDRLTTIWETCGLKDDGTGMARDGWSFTNGIPGKDRGAKDSADGNIELSCEVALRGVKAPNGGDTEGDIGQYVLNDVDGDDDKDGRATDQTKRLVTKFDLPETEGEDAYGWQQYYDKNDDGERAAAVTINAMHGVNTNVNFWGAVCMTLSSLVNFVIFGGVYALGKALLQVMLLVCCLALAPALLLYASGWDRGSKAMASAVKWCAGSAMGSALLTYGLMIVMQISTVVTNAVGGTGAGTVRMIMMGLSPILTLKLFQFIGEKVLHLGNISVRGLMGSMIGGSAIMAGLGKLTGLGKAAPGMIGASVAGAVGGYQQGGALGALRGAASANGRNNSLYDKYWAGRNAAMHGRWADGQNGRPSNPAAAAAMGGDKAEAPTVVPPSVGADAAETTAMPAVNPAGDAATSTAAGTPTPEEAGFKPLPDAEQTLSKMEAWKRHRANNVSDKGVAKTLAEVRKANRRAGRGTLAGNRWREIQASGLKGRAAVGEMAKRTALSGLTRAGMALTSKPVRTAAKVGFVAATGGAGLAVLAGASAVGKARRLAAGGNMTLADHLHKNLAVSHAKQNAAGYAMTAADDENGAVARLMLKAQTRAAGRVVKAETKANSAARTAGETLVAASEGHATAEQLAGARAARTEARQAVKSAQDKLDAAKAKTVDLRTLSDRQGLNAHQERDARRVNFQVTKRSADGINRNDVGTFEINGRRYTGTRGQVSDYLNKIDAAKGKAGK